MKKVITIRATFARAILASAVATVSYTLVAAQTVAEVDEIVQKTIYAKSVPSVAVAVVKDGKVVLAKGYGSADIPAGAMASENTVYQVASLTKQFTAVAVMMLVDEGKLTLSDPLGKHLPDVPAKWRGVTVRQLLNQVSGIPNYTAGSKLVADKAYTKAEILAIVRDVPTVFEPGTNWQYSNTNYYLLGMIIEKLSDKTYADFMRERIFKPLAMTTTAINTSGTAIKNAAVGYVVNAGDWKPQVQEDPSQPWAAGAIVSTAADLAKWALAQGDANLLKKASWDEIWTAAKLADGKSSAYGFGWRTAALGDITYWNHGGSIAGFQSHIARFPNENVSVAVLSNTNGRVPEQLAFDIAGLYVPKVGAAIAAQRAAASAAPIVDADPDTTKFLRSAFEKMVTGDISPDLFNAEMQKLLFPDRVKELKGPLSTQGSIKAFDLMRADNSAEGKRRVYRITFEGGLKLAGNFTVDPQGKISGASFRPER